jgi:hypothetical protein
MNCNKCGAELQPEEKFCPNCGTPAAVQPAPVGIPDPNYPAYGQPAPGAMPDPNYLNANNYDPNSAYPEGYYAQPAKPQPKRQAFPLAIAGLAVAVVMLIILFAFDYVIVAYITFIAPVLSCVYIKRDKANGYSGFIPTVLINVATFIIAVILVVIYIGATSA